MAATLTFALAASGCVQPAPKATGPVVVAPVRVAGLRNFEGATARKSAEADCARLGKRLVTSIYDRFDGANWVFAGGCQ